MKKESVKKAINDLKVEKLPKAIMDKVNGGLDSGRPYLPGGGTDIQ